LIKGLSFFAARRPEEVFTPRAALVNKSMYIARPDYEQELIRALRSKYHIVIYGDSGCGKSWLYKKVFDQLRVEYTTVDLSTATHADDVDLCLLDALEQEEWVETERTAERTRGVMPGDIGYQQKGTIVSVKQEDSALVQLCSTIRKKAGSRKAFIVFENIEHAISHQDVVVELRSLLLALDDQRFAALDVQICMVGVPFDIKSLLTDGNKYQTISNRVVEISEISRMSKDQAKLLILQGFTTELGMDLESQEYCISQITYLTDRIPQYLHDVCLQVAFIAEENGSIINPKVISDAAHVWVETNARQSREFIERIVGPGKVHRSQKAKIIFAISKVESTFFYAQDVDTILREQFPATIGSSRIQLMKMLNKLSSGELRILKKDDQQDKFRVVTPKLRSVLRYCLAIDQNDETVLLRQQTQ